MKLLKKLLNWIKILSTPPYKTIRSCDICKKKDGCIIITVKGGDPTDDEKISFASNCINYKPDGVLIGINKDYD